MKITNIETYPVWGGSRNFLFVVVDTDEGISGVGEAGITGRELAVIGAIEHFKPLLIGQDPLRIEHLWQVLFRGGFFPAQRILASAISAIDIALWDIKGKALGVPIYELLGGRVRDKVVCYPHNVGHGMDDRAAGRVVPADQSRRAGSSCAGACRRTGEHAGAAPGGAGGDRAVPGRARGGRRRDRADLRRPHPARSARRGLAVPGGRAVPPVLHRRSAALGEPRLVQDAAAAHARAAGGRRAVQLEVGVPPADRGGVDRLRPHRPVHRRRLHRGAQDRRLVRDALYQAGAAQPARAGLSARPACSSTWPARTSACRSSRAAPARC